MRRRWRLITKSEFFANLLCDVGVRSPAAFAVTVPAERFSRVLSSRGHQLDQSRPVTKILRTNSASCKAICRGDGFSELRQVIQAESDLVSRETLEAE